MLSSLDPAAKIAPASADDVVVRCSQLVKRYGALLAVDHLDLEVGRGTCVGLLGPNGAGKTTTVEILEGLLSPDGGAVEVLGQRWRGAGERQLRQRIGVQLQETRLSEKLTVMETVRLFRSFHARGRAPAEVIELLGLTEKTRVRLERLSGGQRQRVALACALVSDPEVLFLDEPTTGLDPQARLRIWEVVERYLAAGGTVILTTHYMEEAAQLCHRVVIIDRGRCIAEGSPAALVAGLGGEQVIVLELAGDVDPAALAAVDGVEAATRHKQGYHLTVTDIGRCLPALLRELERRSAQLETLTTREATLDDVFITLTGRELRDG